jgi:hypothetical protein
MQETLGWTGTMAGEMSERVFERANHQHGPFAHGRALVALLLGVTDHGEVLT